jgi:hypothetical protein
VYARPPGSVFRSRHDEPNGATRVFPGASDADLMILDVPLLSSLIFQNTRSRRILPPDAAPLEIWESLPPEPGVRRFADGGPFVTQDAFGEVYVRRRRLGAATPLRDASARLTLPGGVPFVYAVHARLHGEREARLHHQREESQLYPGEALRQSFRRELFDGVCGSCHGALSGREEDIALDPDILTRASDVAARTARPVDLTRASASPSGPPFP